MATSAQRARSNKSILSLLGYNTFVGEMTAKGVIIGVTMETLLYTYHSGQIASDRERVETRVLDDFAGGAQDVETNYRILGLQA